jgi:CheY-like chemotaxis protein
MTFERDAMTVKAVGHMSDYPPITEDAGAPTPRLPEHRVLVVDDTRDSAFILSKLLVSLGQRVATADNGTSALEAARQARPDVVISDIAMAGMDGYELARRIRQDPALAGVRLVALTGYDHDADRQRAMQAGFDHHLVKPVSVEVLKNLFSSLPVLREANAS